MYLNAKLQSWLWLCFACLLAAPAPLHSQGGIWGAEMQKLVSRKEVKIYLQVYREGQTVPEVMLDWGDGSTSMAGSVRERQLEGNRFFQVYEGQHEYAEAGIYAIGFVDSFLVEGIANVASSGSQAISFRDSVHIDPSETFLISNKSPEPMGPLYDSFFAQVEGGVLLVPISFHQQVDMPFGYFEELEAELVPFPAAGYSDPPGAAGIAVYTSDNAGSARLVWDRPIEPGRYALCMKVNEYRDFEGARYFMSTNHFAFIVDVDEDMIVSTSSPSAEALPLQLYPNPTTSTLYLKAKLPSQASALLTVQDAMGRELLRQPLPAGRVQHELDVSAWPAGVYFLRLRQGAVDVVERFVKGE